MSLDSEAQVLAVRPADADRQYNLGIALARAGRLDDAIAHFSAARKNLEIAVGQRDASRR
jgi:Flp pilus assembly protein TadD